MNCFILVTFVWSFVSCSSYCVARRLMFNLNGSFLFLVKTSEKKVYINGSDVCLCGCGCLWCLATFQWHRTKASIASCAVFQTGNRLQLTKLLLNLTKLKLTSCKIKFNTCAHTQSNSHLSFGEGNLHFTCTTKLHQTMRG